MENVTLNSSPSDASAPLPPVTGLSAAPSRTLTKLALVPFRNGEAVSKHPELQSLLKEGWTIRSAVPRIVESEGTKLLVVLVKPEMESRLLRIK